MPGNRDWQYLDGHRDHDGRATTRRVWCPLCQTFGATVGGRCHCGAEADRRFAPVDVDGYEGGAE